MQIAEIMTRDVAYLSADESVQRAAQLMADLDIGAVPVCDGRRLVGVVTDRDIAVRCTAAGAPATTSVREAMTPHVSWCYEDEEADTVKAKMRDEQIRRLPILGKNNELVGMVSLGDLATKTGGTDETLAGISEPARASGELFR
ncbi:CBS domain-containing protein [Pigmentiphaga sp. NML080357]|uniref:CBS domain-containing protein n=1 Tax=Pigmentiphaga sp. NML080357 TaxID=2008675 RepID=UPI000B42272E|nr:CBS domain-containing protein [Pigmentiphaga sp. NML080357]OVZ58826.1 CBS domain-containing protein [Pigmentiphaga sp. NML080357]